MSCCGSRTFKTIEDRTCPQQPLPRDHSFRHSWRGQLRTIAVVAIGASAVYFGLTRYVVLVGQVVGTSMTPTLEPGARYAINRLAYRWRAPARGDIVAVRLPSESDLIVKRIVALPGERVAMRGGMVLVNGTVLQELYLTPGTRTAAKRMGHTMHEVAADCYFLLGDRRETSADSRMDGAVPKAWIVGLVVSGELTVKSDTIRSQGPAQISAYK